MNERALHPAHLASAALAVGGMLVALQPQHATSIVQLTLVTVAAGAGLHALVVSVPTAWWTSPFAPSGHRREQEPTSGELDRIRSRMTGRRRVLDGGAALPPEALAMLRPLVEVAMEMRGLDPDRPSDLDTVRRLLSPTAAAVLAADPRERPPWYRMRRPDPREVAETVHAVMDELEAFEDVGSPAP